MKIWLVGLLGMLSLAASSQIKLNPTDKFTIDGRIKRPLIFTIADLDTFSLKSLPDCVITDHMGTPKQVLRRMKGILLKDILAKAVPDAENPKVLSEYYFVLEAPDKYRVVFSWNEMFNTQTGNNVYIVMAEGGKKITESENRISIVSLTDIRTGRRHMSNINKITVGRAE